MDGALNARVLGFLAPKVDAVRAGARATSQRFQSWRLNRPTCRVLQGSWSTQAGYQFEFKIVRPWWPPLTSSSVFLPRLRFEIRNNGQSMRGAGVSFYVSPFDQPIGRAPNATAWHDVLHQGGPLQPWTSGGLWVIRAKLRGRSFPRADSYVLKFTISEYVAETREQVGEKLRTVPDLRQAIRQDASPETRASYEMMFDQLEASHREQLRAIDAGEWNPNHTVSRPACEYTLAEYIRIEPLSNALTFLVVSGTLVAAVAALITALVAITAT